MTFWDHTLVELFNKGGFCMWPILACSILGMAIILDRSWMLLRTRTDFGAFVRKLQKLVLNGQEAEIERWLGHSECPLSRVAKVYLEHVDAPAELRENVVEREASQQIARMELRMNWLATVASVSTLLGLLGTVTGLVTAFHAIELNAGSVQPGDLAAGIWEALITTVFGLIVAIPTLAAYHLLDHQAGRAALQLEWLVGYLDEWCHPNVADTPKEAVS